MPLGMTIEKAVTKAKLLVQRPARVPQSWLHLAGGWEGLAGPSEAAGYLHVFALVDLKGTQHAPARPTSRGCALEH